MTSYYLAFLLLILGLCLLTGCGDDDDDDIPSFGDDDSDDDDDTTGNSDDDDSDDDDDTSSDDDDDNDNDDNDDDDTTPDDDDDDDDNDDNTPYSHTITIDGENDFLPTEEFETTSTGYAGFISWDATYLYVGMDGASVGSGASKYWFLVYIQGDGGTTDGLLYNSQQPTLPFPAKYHIRWKADNSYTNAQVYDTVYWFDGGWDFSGDVFQTDNFIEMRIPFADIGNPSSPAVHLSMINEHVTEEWTFAGVPNSSFMDGYNVNYSKYMQFNLSSGVAPNMYTPLPIK